MLVDVYWNIHKKCWSVKDRKTRRIARHAPTLFVRNVKFVVQKAGRAKVIRQKRKNVHAFVRGESTDFILDITHNPNMQIIYNPYKMKTFQDADGQEANGASLVWLTKDGKCYKIEG